MTKVVANVEGREYIKPYGPCKLADEHIVRKEYHTGYEDNMEFMRALLKHFMITKDPMVVPVLSYKELGTSEQYGYPYHKYSYDMLRCLPLSEDERLIVDCSHGGQYERRLPNGKKDLPGKFPKLVEFLAKVHEKNYYHDLHGNNVMVRPDGEYCLIDLESFLNAPLSHKTNDWITR